MSELAKWVEILWGFTNFNFKLNLKVSAFYLEKQKSFIPKKKYFLSRTAKVDLKDGFSRPNFQWRFWSLHAVNFQNNKYIDAVELNSLVLSPSFTKLFSHTNIYFHKIFNEVATSSFKNEGNISFALWKKWDHGLFLFFYQSLL